MLIDESKPLLLISQQFAGFLFGHYERSRNGGRTTVPFLQLLARRGPAFRNVRVPHILRDRVVPAVPNHEPVVATLIQLLLMVRTSRAAVADVV